MSKPTNKRSVRAKTSTRVKKAKPAPGRPAPPVEQPSPEDEAAYVESLIQSGQAAHLNEEGKLPAGATHKIVGDDQGNVKVVRRRFSIS